MKKIIALLLAAFMTVTAAAAEGGDGTATVTPGNEKMPVYVIKSGNGTSVMLMYTGGEFKSEKMGSGESGNFNVSSVLFKEDTNYLPFRYLLKKFEYKDMTGYVENDKDWSEKKELFKNENTGKRAFIWVQDDSGKIKIAVLLNDELIELIQDEEIKKLEGSYKPIIEKEKTYLPMRALECLGLMVKYDPETNAVYIAEKLEEEKYNEVKKAYKAMFNDNYATYSSAYVFPGKGVNVFKDQDFQRCYGYCQYGDIVIYLNSKQEIYVRERKETNKGDYPLQIDGKNIIADKMVFDGRAIYGIKLDSADDESGGYLFEAVLSVDGNGRYIMKDFIKREEKNARYLILKTEASQQYLYYIDVNDSETIKKIKSSDINAEPITVCKQTDDGTEPLTNISHFGVNNGYIIYYNYIDNIMTAGKYDFNIDDKNNMLINQIIYSSEDYKAGLNGMVSDCNENPKCDFYFITAEDQDENKVYGIKINRGADACETKFFKTEPGKKIRNIAVIDGDLYGRVGDAYEKIEEEEIEKQVSTDGNEQ